MTLAVIAVVTWIDAVRLSRLVAEDTEVIAEAAETLREAGKALRRGAVTTEYSTVQTDALQATLEFSERTAGQHIRALKRLAEVDPEFANQLADEALDTTAVLREKMPNLSSAADRLTDQLGRLR